MALSSMHTARQMAKTLVLLIRFDHQHIKGIINGVGDFEAAHAFLSTQLYHWGLAVIQVEVDPFTYR